MEGGLPMLNCLLQHTLRSLCNSCDSSSSSKWVYSVFWRILPRNYPPPRWDYGGGVLDRSKGNKRNWILVWEDGFCNFLECERVGSSYMEGKFGADIFFKMSHEVYNYGEGLMGKVAAENTHKWVFRENATENELSFISSWNASVDSQPKAWESQFNSGIQTIAAVAVREGVIQLGSFDKVEEDLNLVIGIQRKFNYLQSMPGVLAMKRPYSASVQHANALRFSNRFSDINGSMFLDDKKQVLTGSKRFYTEGLDESSIKSTNFGWNSPQHGGIFWSIPPLLPYMSRSLGALLSKLPSVIPSGHAPVEILTSSESNNGEGESKIGSFELTLKDTVGMSVQDSCLAMRNGNSAVVSDLPDRTEDLNSGQYQVEQFVQLVTQTQGDGETIPNVLNNTTH